MQCVLHNADATDLTQHKYIWKVYSTQWQYNVQIGKFEVNDTKRYFKKKPKILLYLQVSLLCDSSIPFVVWVSLPFF